MTQLELLKEEVLKNENTVVPYGQMPIISYSQFSMYARCPKSWELGYVKKLRSYKPSIHTLFGTSLHEALQNYLSVAFTQSGKAADEIDLHAYLKTRLVENYTLELGKQNGEHFTTPEELNSFYEDGCEILTWVKRRRKVYFTPKGLEFIGVEIPMFLPVNVEINPTVHFVAYVDLVFYDKVFNRVKIIDIKTSSRGWTDKDKKDSVKKSQVMLYKYYFSQKFNIPIQDIEVEFFIVKRKLHEAQHFPQKRVQVYTPSQGRSSILKVLNNINEFVAQSFNQDGSYNTERDYPAIAGEDGENCKYCEFKDKPELCPAGKRLKTLPS